MSIRKTIQIGDPRLHAKNETVKDFYAKKTRKIVKDLVDTMRENGLVGMAAPQIAENYKIFVTEPRKTKTRKTHNADGLKVFINPEIVKLSKKETIIYEGCGSVIFGQIFGPVKRPEEIVVEAYNEDGKKFRLTCNGLLAIIILHENDHLLGVEFTEKISDYRELLDKEHYLKMMKTRKEKVENTKKILEWL